ncbi:helix-turn-helix domain-containing protein [Paenibacillus sp. FSL H8-0122]|uniref:AraC family transcriptional regulator n=1 Tax=Paenibacillus sp. FSL H8-0122 TaxID=2954510 RepID=UPI0030FC0C1A
MEAFPLFTGDYLFDSCSPVQMLLTQKTVTSVRHQHDFVELAYVVQGTGIHLAGEDKMQVTQGDVLVIPPGVSHVFHPQDLSGAEPLLILSCMLRPGLGRMLSELPGPLSEESRLPLLKLLEVRQWFGYREKNKEILFLLGRLQGMLNSGLLMDEQRLYPPLLELAKLIMPAADVPFTRRPEPQYDPLHDVILYMISNYSERITLNEMSGHLAMSSRQFQRLLKNKTGRSYIQIFQEIRMKYSCILLLFTKLGVQSVALKVGIYDMKYFYRLFREFSGMTPASYRNRLHSHSSSAKEMISSVEHCSC